MSNSNAGDLCLFPLFPASRTLRTPKMFGFLSVWRFLILSAHGPPPFTRCVVSWHLAYGPVSLHRPSCLSALTAWLLTSVFICILSDFSRNLSTSLSPGPPLCCYLITLDIWLGSSPSSRCCLITPACLPQESWYPGRSAQPEASFPLRLPLISHPLSPTLLLAYEPPIAQVVFLELGLISPLEGRVLWPCSLHLWWWPLPLNKVFLIALSRMSLTVRILFFSLISHPSFAPWIWLVLKMFASKSWEMKKKKNFFSIKLKKNFYMIKWT